MPIRRRSDGEIVDEKTEPVAGKPARPDNGRSAEAPTERVGVRGKPDKDSLFGATKPVGRTANRLEEPTVPMGARPVGNDGKTRLVAARKGVGATPRLEADDPMRDPPVGWLVVVRGPGSGRVLTLGNGMNSLGRGAQARVRIDFGDDTIARSNHARLAYEPRRRTFHLSHGDGANLTYLDGEVVMKPIEIASGACIEMGETTLRFQAFCGKEFDWPDLDD